MKKQIIWSDDMIQILQDLYPVETTSYVASVLGVCENTVKKKARELGIEKFAKSKWLERADYIRNHFYSKTFSEIGRELGIAKWSVARIAEQLGLKRSDKETCVMKSKARTELIKREKRRMIFGLDPITHIKVVTNRPRIRLRSWLKAQGYVVGEQRNVMYYPSDISRRMEHESRGRELGLRFLPMPTEEKLFLTTAI